MQIHVSQDADRARLAIEGEIDEQGAEQLKQQFRTLNTGMLSEVILDFSQVTFIGSAGIGKLLLIYKDLGIKGAAIRVENAPPAIFELLQIVKLDTILTISKAA